MIVKLIYRSKSIDPYLTRVTIKEPPKTIVHNNVVFQNLNIVNVGNKPVYQYREVPSVELSTIELKTAIPIKFQSDLHSKTESRNPLTARQLKSLLNKCPHGAKIFFGKLGTVRSVEERFCRKEGVVQIWLHDSAPMWNEIGVKVISELKDQTFAETSEVAP